MGNDWCNHWSNLVSTELTFCKSSCRSCTSGPKSSSMAQLTPPRSRSTRWRVDSTHVVSVPVDQRENKFGYRGIGIAFTTVSFVPFVNSFLPNTVLPIAPIIFNAMHSYFYNIKPLRPSTISTCISHIYPPAFPLFNFLTVCPPHLILCSFLYTIILQS